VEILPGAQAGQAQGRQDQEDGGEGQAEQIMAAEQPEVLVWKFENVII